MFIFKCLIRNILLIDALHMFHGMFWNLLLNCLFHVSPCFFVEICWLEFSHQQRVQHSSMAIISEPSSRPLGRVWEHVHNGMFSLISKYCVIIHMHLIAWSPDKCFVSQIYQEQVLLFCFYQFSLFYCLIFIHHFSFIIPSFIDWWEENHGIYMIYLQLICALTYPI